MRSGNRSETKRNQTNSMLIESASAITNKKKKLMHLRTSFFTNTCFWRYSCQRKNSDLLKKNGKSALNNYEMC